MKKLSLGITIFFILLFLPLILLTAGFTEYGDVEKYPSCIYCGMDRNTFAYSRILIEYEDGAALGMCSLHCAVKDIALKIDTPIKRIMVGDYNTKELINAETAHWVIGGDKTGVMTKRAKWAFENKQEALAFINENGGQLAVFDDAVQASFEDMSADIQMIREKRQMKHKKNA